MASPAAVLAVLVEANTTAATASLSKYNAELDATKANSVAATGSAGKMTSTLSKLGTVAKVGAAAGVAAFGLAAKSSFDTTEELAKSTITLHKNLGLSTKAASEWAGVARARGVDTTKLGMAFKTLASQVNAAHGGSATSVEMFKKLGFSQRDLQRSMHDSEFAISQVAKGFGDLPAGIDKTTFASKLFGRGWQTIFPILRDGNKAMQDQLGLVDKYGGAFSGKNERAWSNFLATQREMKIAWQGVQVQLANALLPTIHSVDDQFRKVAAILGSDKLSNDQKIAKLTRLIRGDFETVLKFLTDHIATIAENAGHFGEELAVGIVHGFLNSDALGKLVISAWILKAFGGATAIKAVGGKLAMMLFGGSAAGGAAGGLGGAATTVATKADPVPVWVVNQIGGPGSGGGVGGAGGPLGASAEAAGGKVFGPENIAPKAGLGFADTAMRHPIGTGAGIATLIAGFSAMGAPDVKQSLPNDLNAAAHGMDPTKVLHLVGLPALSDLLPEIEKNVPQGQIMDFLLTGRTGPIGPTTAGGHTLTAKGQTPASELVPSGPLGPMGQTLSKGIPDFGAKGKRSLEDIQHWSTGVQTEFSKVMKRQAKIDLGWKDVEGAIHQFTGSEASIRKWSSDTVDLFGKVMDKNGKLRDSSGKTRTALSKDADSTQKSVNVSYAHLSGGVRGAISDLNSATNDALRAVGADPVSFTATGSTTNPGKHNRVGTSHRAAGGYIDGAGTGDKVHILAEPGEYMLNKNLVSAIGVHNLNAMNSKVGRFAKGGIVAAGKLAQRMGMIPSENPAFGGVTPGAHVSGSYHYSGQAIDVSGGAGPGSSQWKRYVSAVRRGWLGHGLAEQFYDLLPNYVKNDQIVPGQIGGHSDHVHVAILSNFLGSIAGAVAKLKRSKIVGPAGPARTIGQGASDLVWKAAQAYLSKQGGGGAAEAGLGPGFKGGKTVAASWYGPTPSTTGGSGVDLRGKMAFAELGWHGGPETAATGLGGLPYGSKLRIGYHGKSIVGTKLDVGSGGPGIGGYPRAIDLWEDLANALHFDKAKGIDLVQVQNAMRGGEIPAFGAGTDYVARHPHFIKVGDSGPERVRVSPVGGNDGGGGGGAAPKVRVQVDNHFPKELAWLGKFVDTRVTSHLDDRDNWDSQLARAGM